MTARKTELATTRLQHVLSFMREHRTVKVQMAKDRSKTVVLIRIKFRDSNLANWLDDNFDELTQKLGRVSDDSLALSGVERGFFGGDELLVCLLHEENPKSVDGLDWLLSLFNEQE